MNPRLARRLTRFYPSVWRERYGTEFEVLLQSCSGDLRTITNILGAALRQRFAPVSGSRLQVERRSGSSQIHSWCTRAPWAIFGVAPLLILAAAYSVALIILWSGWSIFLPEANTPFVRVDGPAVFYFGAGRLLYYVAPVLVGWSIGFTAARHKAEAIWPLAGMVLVALVGGTVGVHASRLGIPGGLRHIGMDFALGAPKQGSAYGLWHPVTIFVITVLPVVLWSLHRRHSSFA